MLRSIMETEGDKRIEEILSLPIVLTDRLRSSLSDASHFKHECSEIGRLAETLSHLLRSAVRYTTAAPPSAVYHRPVVRIFSDVSTHLTRALSLVRKCRRRSFLKRLFNIVTTADFRKQIVLIESSIGDATWLLRILEPGTTYSGSGILLSLPPIANNDPVLAWVWSYISSLYNSQLSLKIEAANELSSFARDSERNKKIIVEEGGIPPLLKLLKEGVSLGGQVAAVSALFNLANDQDRARVIVSEQGVPIIVQAVANGPIRVQIMAANVVARMAEFDTISQEIFARENVIRPLVTLLSFETFTEEDYPRENIKSIADINKHVAIGSALSFSFKPSPCSSVWSGNRKDRESEDPELKLVLKTSCARALCMLARGNVVNCKKITETRGLLCLAKLLEKEEGDLMVNCLMAVMEIAASAESNADLRRSAFKANSPAAKASMDQLLRLVTESKNPEIEILSIRAIGSLARTFPARETRVISPLVRRLGHPSQDVATEAVIALAKFAGQDNFLCLEHSKTIIVLNAVPHLMRLLREKERTQVHALKLLCYLAINAGDSEAFAQSRVLMTLEGADRSVAAQNSELRELVSKAIIHLQMYQAGVVSRRLSYSS